MRIERLRNTAAWDRAALSAFPLTQRWRWSTAFWPTITRRRWRTYVRKRGDENAASFNSTVRSSRRRDCVIGHHRDLRNRLLLGWPLHLVSGAQYARTLETWLEKLDGQREAAIAVLRACKGHIPAERHLQRWRLFLLACAELFAYRGGNEWYVSHYRFRKQEADFR